MLRGVPITECHYTTIFTQYLPRMSLYPDITVSVSMYHNHSVLILQVARSAVYAEGARESTPVVTAAHVEYYAVLRCSPPPSSNKRRRNGVRNGDTV